MEEMIRQLVSLFEIPPSFAVSVRGLSVYGSLATIGWIRRRGDWNVGANDKGSDDWCKRMAQAAEPVKAAAQVFSDSARNCRRFSSGFSTWWDGFKGAVWVDRVSLGDSTRYRYLEVTGTIRTMVSELNRAHGGTVRISGGVDEALIQPFAQMTAECKCFKQRSALHLINCSRWLLALNKRWNNLKKDEDPSVLAEHIQQAGGDVQAAASFVLVSEQLQQIVPQLEHTSQVMRWVHKRCNASQRFAIREQSKRTNARTSSRVVRYLESTQIQMAERVAKESTVHSLTNSSASHL